LKQRLSLLKAIYRHRRSGSSGCCAAILRAYRYNSREFERRRSGLEGFRSGDAATGIEALKYAAAGGELLAQWKLAKIYANGDGVTRDDIKAYDYFSQIVSNYDEDDPNRRDLAIVSSAFDAIGAYNLKWNSQQQSTSRSATRPPNVPIRRDQFRQCRRPI